MKIAWHRKAPAGSFSCGPLSSAIGVLPSGWTQLVHIGLDNVLATAMRWVDVV